MSTTIITRDFSDFLTKWENTPNELDLSQAAMILDASEAVLKTKFPRKQVTPGLIVDFGKIIAMQLLQTTAK